MEDKRKREVAREKEKRVVKRGSEGEGEEQRKRELREPSERAREREKEIARAVS